jgi:hypothetical protein
LPVPEFKEKKKREKKKEISPTHQPVRQLLGNYDYNYETLSIEIGV